MDRKIKIDYFAISINDNCNLNCKCCGSCAPLAQRPNFVDIEKLKSWILKLYDVARFNRIVVLGGEPLLHKDVFEIIDYVSDVFKNTQVGLYTNGILLKQNLTYSHVKILQKKNVEVMFSKYSIKFDYDNLFKILNVLHINNYINVNWTQKPKDETDYWTQIRIDKKQNKTPYCFMANEACDMVVKNGKIYGCSVISSVDLLNEYFNENIQILNNEDFINIENITVDILNNFVKKIKTMEMPFCKMCAGTKLHTKWGISKKERSEWIK